MRIRGVNGCLMAQSYAVCTFNNVDIKNSQLSREIKRIKIAALMLLASQHDSHSRRLIKALFGS